jgi:peptidoglycan/LPS O-acetylase OafA/YrhL
MVIAAAREGSRIPALDFTKGALVLIMVLYHWLNYFVSADGGFYRYLRFLTPSFIFITGFLISHVYLAAYRNAISKVPIRLMQRGLKILAVFILLNAARMFLIPDARSSATPFETWVPKELISVFVTGNVSAAQSAKAAAFIILVPISYMLLLSAALVPLARFHKHAFHTVCLAFLLCIYLLRLHGLEYGNLELVTIGLLGVIVGYSPIEKIDAFVKHPYLLAAAYLCYAGAITIWGIIYPLQIVGVCICLMIIYLVGGKGVEPDWVRSRIILLGRYSLFGYIAQIAILQGLYRVLSPLGLGVATLVVSFFAAFALTMLTVVMLDRARARLPIVDGLYKVVFA